MIPGESLAGPSQVVLLLKRLQFLRYSWNRCGYDGVIKSYQEYR